MKEVHLYAIFFAVVSVAFVFLWWYVSPSSLQVGGAIWGIPSTDAVTPFVASLLIFWFMLVGFVMYANHKR